MGNHILEIHVPISPTPAFLNRIHYLAASLASRGGALSDSPIVVTVGADRDPEDLTRSQPWSKRYPIEWRWLDRDLFRREGYYATAVDRFCASFRARNVMMLDADILVHGNFEDLIALVEQEYALFGMPALGSPWYTLWHQRPHEEWWQLVFDAAGLGRVPYVAQHTSWGVIFGRDTPRFSPPYLNGGVLAAPAEIMKRIGATIYRHMSTVSRVVETIYKCQIALTMAIVEQGLPWKSMPIRYNFPNYPAMAAAYTRELADVRLLHYLNADSVDLQRDRDLDSPQAVAEWLGKPVTSEPVDLVVRGSFAGIHRVVAAPGNDAPGRDAANAAT